MARCCLRWTAWALGERVGPRSIWGKRIYARVAEWQRGGGPQRTAEETQASKDNMLKEFAGIVLVVVLLLLVG